MPSNQILFATDGLTREDVAHLVRNSLEQIGLTVRSGVHVGEGFSKTICDLAVISPTTDEILLIVKVHRDAGEHVRWTGTRQHLAYKRLPVPFLRFRGRSEGYDQGFLSRIQKAVQARLALNSARAEA